MRVKHTNVVFLFVSTYLKMSPALPYIPVGLTNAVTISKWTLVWTDHALPLCLYKLEVTK